MTFQVCKRTLLIGEVYLILILAVACKNNTMDNSIEKRWLGREIAIPLQKDNLSVKNNKTGLKIVTRINGHCYSCLLQLKDWQNLMEGSLFQESVSYYIYIVVPDSIYFNRINDMEIHFNYPIICDPYDMFRKHNNLENNPFYHTMLLDSNNHVLGIGNPISNPNTLALYKDILKRH